jgi:predicted signal transduction protein with EAL and GGDEF domain
MGVKIAIDDFGMGYSSLGYLAKLPVHAVKIDRSFVGTMIRNPNSMAIVATIISLAHAIGLTVIAERVEKFGAGPVSPGAQVRRAAGLPLQLSDSVQCRRELSAKVG